MSVLSLLQISSPSEFSLQKFGKGETRLVGYSKWEESFLHIRCLPLLTYRGCLFWENVLHFYLPVQLDQYSQWWWTSIMKTSERVLVWHGLPSWEMAKHLCLSDAGVLIIASGAHDTIWWECRRDGRAGLLLQKEEEWEGKETRAHTESQSNWWGAGGVPGELGGKDRGPLSSREIVPFSQL